MAVSGNRSPSPISARSNHCSRTPETSSTVRRSFSENPFSRPSILTNPRSFTPATPANSPADLGRRHSIGKEDKENEKDQILRPAKARSPAVPKGTKNFMSPTISAASKINASPRKKVLVERNEPIRSSVSFSEAKSLMDSISVSNIKDESHSEPEMGFDQSELDSSTDPEMPNLDDKDTVLEVSLASKPLEKDECLKLPQDSKKASQLLDLKSVEPKLTSSLMPPVIAPLDADPSLTPYDPKTNYLSPRPKFLHYKPNPRLEAYLHKENIEGQRVEESNESFSDTEGTEETESETSQKEPEEASSPEIVNEEKVEAATASNLPQPVTAPITEDSMQNKRRFLTRPKAMVFILVLVAACVLVPLTDSPQPFDLSIYKDLSFSKFHDSSQVSDFAKTSFKSLTGKMKQWSVESVQYLNKLIPILGDANKTGPSRFSNLTASLDDPFMVVQKEEKIEVMREQDQLLEVEDEEIEENKEDGPDEEAENKIEEEETLEGEGIEEEAPLMIEAKPIEPDYTAEAAFEVRSSLALYPIDLNPGVIETEEIQGEENGVISSSKSDSDPESFTEKDASFEDSQSFKREDVSPKFSENKLAGDYKLGIPVLALALIVASIFLPLKLRRSIDPTPEVSEDKALAKKLMTSSSTEHINFQEEDEIGESCPSEMSSFQKSSSYSKRGLGGGQSQVQSQERRQRRVSKRESLASSSDFSMGGSPSYGSFTTYEKIPSKHGTEEEEIMTPVRRSSRIKHQVTSP